MESFTYQLMRDIEDEHWWFVARRKILKELLATLKLPVPSDILEVGCGTGGNISFLQAFGNVIGVESDESAAMMAKQRKQAPILAGSLPDELPDFERQFDLIVLFDVIEHIDKDGESLQTLASLLKPGGHIVLTVPAFSFLWSQHDDENQHKRRYNRRNLRAMVTCNGFRIDYLSYFNFWLFPVVAAIRLFRKALPYKGSWQDMRKPTLILNKLLQLIFSSERHLIGKLYLPFGMSLVTVISATKHETES